MTSASPRPALIASYGLALAGAAPWLMFLPSMVPALNVIAMVFVLGVIPLGLIGLAAPLVWGVQWGRGFARHGRAMLWALPGLPVAFSTYALLV